MTDNCDAMSTTCMNNVGSFTCPCDSGYEPITGSSTMCQGQCIWCCFSIAAILVLILCKQISMSVRI